MPVSRVSFRLPREVQQAFHEAFAGEDKNAVIARLMQQAIDERQRQRRRSVAIDGLIALRRGVCPVSDDEIAAARREGRP